MVSLPSGRLWNEDLAKSYETYSTNPNSIYQQTNSKLVDLIPLGTYECVLDLGCGNGQTTTSLLNRFCPKRLIAVDISKDQLKRYMDRFLEISGIDFKLENSLFLRVSQAPKSLDLIVSNASINHMGNLRDVFEKAKLLLKSGGIFAFSVFDHVSQDAQNSFYSILADRLKYYALINKIKYADIFQPKISSEEIKDLAEGYSFSLEEQKKFSFVEEPSLIRSALKHYSDRLLYEFFPELPEDESKRIILKEGDKLLEKGHTQRQIFFNILKK